MKIDAGSIPASSVDETLEPGSKVLVQAGRTGYRVNTIVHNQNDEANGFINKNFIDQNFIQL